MRKANVVIIGGGIAGIAAAIAAAEENANVILVDKHELPGGNATQSFVGTFCGLYYQQEELAIVKNPFVKSFIKGLKNERSPLKHSGLWVLPYSNHQLQEYLLNLIRENNITYLPKSHVWDVKIKDSSIFSVAIENSESKKNINCDAVIDCSGIGIVSELAGLPMIKESQYQAGSQMFIVSQITSENEFSLNMMLKKEAIKNNQRAVSVVPGSLIGDEVTLKVNLSQKITDRLNLSTFSNESVKEVNSIFASLKENLTTFSNSQIKHIYPEPGIRTLQRPIGKYVLTEEDVVNGKHFANGVAIGTWPIEEWDYNGEVSLTPLNQANYIIPKECLESATLKNLYFGGKNISATTRAIASARVMGTCLQTGYAAGKLAFDKEIELL